MIRSVVSVLLLFLVASACQPSDHHQAMHGSDVDRAAVADSLERGYGLLQQAADSLPPDVRRMYQGMMQMHMQGMPGRMMDGSPGAMHDDMHGDGMHGDGMERPERSAPESLASGEARASSPGASAEWHRQMMAMHQSMAQMHTDEGRADWADRHTQMQRWHEQMMQADRAPSPTQQDGSSSDESTAPLDAVDAASLYARQCATCHGDDGAGMRRVYPPLAGSAWVTGDPERLARLLLHGLQGRIEVKGTFYNGVMPAFGQRLSNAEIAALMTHLRTSWGNAADSVSAEVVRSVRARHADRTSPWTAEEIARP